MARFFKNRAKTIGKPPGSLIFIGQKKLEQPYIELISFDNKTLTEKRFEDVNEFLEYPRDKKNNWINVVGIHDVALIKAIGKHFSFHPLLLEDIVNTGQSPKIEEGDPHFSFFLKMLSLSDESAHYKSEQLCVVFGPGYILTFQEEPRDVFEPLRERIRNKKGQIRKSNNDYLGYALLDLVVDNYLFIIEAIGAKIEDLEDDILSEKKQVMAEIYHYKREMQYLSKYIRPARAAFHELDKVGIDYFHKDTLAYLSDLQGHISQATDGLHLYREMILDQLNLYHSLVGARLNEIMKVLTIFSVIFIPLTFIAGVYGTNFEFLPELKYKYSYFIFWIVLIVTASGMVLFFKRRKWL